jgi:hypothetical protein
MMDGEVMVMGSEERTELEVILFSVKLAGQLGLATRADPNSPDRIPLVLLCSLPCTFTKTPCLDSEISICSSCPIVNNDHSSASSRQLFDRKQQVDSGLGDGAAVVGGQIDTDGRVGSLNFS